MVNPIITVVTKKKTNKKNTCTMILSTKISRNYQVISNDRNQISNYVSMVGVRVEEGGQCLE